MSRPLRPTFGARKPAVDAPLRRALKWVGRLAGLAFLLLMFLGALFTFTPFSSRATDAWLESLPLEAAGLKLEFASARISISEGLVTLREPGFLDPESGERLIGLTSAQIHIGMGSLLGAWRGKAATIDVPLIELEGPVRVVFTEAGGSLRVEDRLARLYELLVTPRPPMASRIKIALGEVRLNALEVCLDRPNGSAAERLFLSRSRVSIPFDGEATPRLIQIEGAICGAEQPGAPEAGFTMTIRPRADLNEIPIEFTVESFDSSRHLMADLPLDFQIQGGSYRANVRRESEGVWSAHISSVGPSRVTLMGAGAGGEDHRFEEARMDVSLEWNREAGRLELSRLRLNSRDSDLQASGVLDLTPPYRYVALVERAESRGGDLALARHSIFGDGAPVDSRRGRIAFDGEIRGSLERAAPDSILGSYRIEDLTLALPSWPEPIYDIDLGGSITREALIIENGSALIQGVGVQISGRVEGRFWAGEVDRLKIVARTAGNVSGLSELIDRQAGQIDWGFRLTGEIAGSATIELDQPSMGTLSEVLDQAQMSGRLSFSNAVLTDEDWAEPIRNLRGRLEFTESRAEVMEMYGSIGDAEFRLDGVLQGDHRFWKDARTTATLTASLRAESVEQYLTWLGAERPDLKLRGGRIDITAAIEGPVNSLRDIEFEGTARATDLIIEDALLREGTTIAFPAVEVEFDTRSIRIVRARGEMGRLEAVVEYAVAGPVEVSTVITLTGPLEELSRVFPAVSDRIQTIGGNIRTTHSMKFRRTIGADEPAEDLLDAWLSIAGAVREPDWNFLDMGVMEQSGEALITGGKLRFRGWPESATLSGINGRLFYDGSSIRTDLVPLTMQAGENAVNTWARSRINFARGDEPLALWFVFGGSRVNLDDWINDRWTLGGDGVATGPSPFDPEARPRYSVTIDVEKINSFIYRGIEGRFLSGELAVVGYGKRRGRLTWDDVTGQYGQGEVKVGGEWTYDGERHRWAHAITAEDMNAPDLLELTMGRRPEGKRVSGIVSGRADFASDGPRGTPLRGGGHLEMRDSEFVKNPIFMGIARFGPISRFIGIRAVLDAISFSRVEGDFIYDGGTVTFSEAAPLRFEPPAAIVHPLSMSMSGSITADSDVDLVMRLEFVRSLPFVGGIFNSILGSVFRYYVTGPADDPKVTIISNGAPIRP